MSNPKSAKMAKSSTLVALPQLVDIALNCQEGIINFQALHTLFHVMIQQLALSDIGVEFRGDDSKKMQALITTMKPTTTNLYPEYSIVGQRGRKARTSRRISLQDVIREKSEEIKRKEKELQTIDPRRDSKDEPSPNPPPLKSPQGSLLGLKAGDVKTVVVVDSQSTVPQFSVAITKDAFQSLQEEVDKVKEQMKELVELPANMGLLEAVKSPSSPIVDMFQILNLIKRMDGNEEALAKMGSLIEDVARMGSNENNIPPALEEKLQDVKDAVEVASIASAKISYDKKPSVSVSGSKKQSFAGRGKIIKTEIDKKSQAMVANLAKRVSNLEHTVEELSNRPIEVVQMTESRESRTEEPEEEVVQEVVEQKEEISKEESVSSEEERKKKKTKRVSRSDVPMKVMAPNGPFRSMLGNIDLSELSVEDAFTLIQQEFLNLQKWTAEGLQDVDKKIFQPGGISAIDTGRIDSKFAENTEKLKEMNKLYNQQIAFLNDQFNRVQSDMNEVFTKLEIILPGGDSTGIGAETTMDLANKLSILEQEMLTIADHASKLEEEKREQNKQTEAILEQIDVLKIVKANREDLEDALGEKADACMINRKVSHDQFDAACDDLTRGIEEALTKLEEQEELWRQALESLHKEVGTKLDKMEVDPLRDFVNSKLRALQEKFKALTSLKKEHEAAGSKSKFLRNVNCISCDRDVVMRKEMDASLKPKAYAMQPQRNMAPYLAYELDQLRQQRKCVPGSKNLNFIESAIKTRGQKDKDHICNRYCGGSHTTTTPQQRVTRLGHFLDQWGPEIAPLNDEYVKGKDNHMYKARDESLYKKMKQNQAKVNGKGNKEALDPEPETPQHDRDVYISPQAQKVIVLQEQKEQKEQKENPENKKKVHNIGAIPLQGQNSPKQSIDQQDPAASNQ